MYLKPLKFSHPWVWPWALFGCWGAANTALSYYPLSLEMKLWIALGGILVPAWAAFRFAVEKESLIPFNAGKEILPKIPASFWVLLALAAVFLRFHQLTTLSLWPLEDEAMNGHYAIELAERGFWRLTYDFSGMPPLYVWGLGLFFKCFGVSLATLWFFPALLSLLAVGFAFAGARRLFSTSFAFLLAGIWACGFWPLYAGRFSVQGGFLVFWMALSFYLLSVFWRAAGEKSRLRAAGILGLAAGAGFYTFTSWAVVAAALTIVVFNRTAREGAGKWKAFALFFVPEVLLFLILAWTTFSDRGGHFRFVLRNPFGPGWPGLNDFCALFWGSRLPANLFAYRPFWGGYFNPILGALCFLGLRAISKAGFSLWKQALLFFLFILPGFLTGGLDGHRVIQCLPLVLAAAAAGLTVLLSTLPKPRRIFAALLILLLSGGLDAHHLFGVYHSLWTHPKGNWFGSKSMERLRAFGILEEARRRSGPGEVLSDLVPNIFDQSLSVLTYPFDASQNPRVDPSMVHWMGILLNVHYQPYLARLFPGARWFWLSPDIPSPDGGLVLGLFPLPGTHPDLLKKYLLADQASHSLAGSVYDNHDWKSNLPTRQALAGDSRLFKGDPFLEACFWEKMAEMDYEARDYAAQIEDLKRALAGGIAAAHLYNDLGALYLRRGYLREARENFLKALACPFNHTSAAAGLAAVEGLEKNGIKPED